MTVGVWMPDQVRDDRLGLDATVSSTGQTFQVRHDREWKRALSCSRFSSTISIDFRSSFSISAIELLPPKIFKPEAAFYADSSSAFHNSGRFSIKPFAFTISGGNRLFAMVLRPMIKLNRALFAKSLEYLPGGKATMTRF